MTITRKRGRPVGTGKPAEERLKAVGVRMAPSYVELLERLCNGRGESKREVIELGLRLVLAQTKPSALAG